MLICVVVISWYTHVLCLLGCVSVGWKDTVKKESEKRERIVEMKWGKTKLNYSGEQN